MVNSRWNKPIRYFQIPPPSNHFGNGKLYGVAISFQEWLVSAGQQQMKLAWCEKAERFQIRQQVLHVRIIEVSYLLIHWRVPSHIWNMFLCILGLHWVKSLTVKELFPGWYGRKPKNEFRKLWTSISVCIFWAI